MSKRLTVKELMEMLATFPDNMPVLLPGYEGGYNDFENVVGPDTFFEDFYESWYYGKHENASQFTTGVYEKFQAVVIK